MKYKIAETISSKDLFAQFLKETNSPQQAAFQLLDVLTNGAFAAVEEPRRQELIDKTIAKFSKTKPLSAATTSTTRISLSKHDWLRIGQAAGWKASDPLEFSDADVDPSYDADSEDEVIFGEDEVQEESQRIQTAFDDGHQYGLVHNDTLGMPYRQDTELGLSLAKAWFDGFSKARA